MAVLPHAERIARSAMLRVSIAKLGDRATVSAFIARAAIVLWGIAKDCDKLSQALLMTRAELMRHALTMGAMQARALSRQR